MFLNPTPPGHKTNPPSGVRAGAHQRKPGREGGEGRRAGLKGGGGGEI